MDFLEAIDGRDLLIMFTAATLAGVAFYFVRTSILAKAEAALSIPGGGTI
jgi:hypothetical protein